MSFVGIIGVLLAVLSGAPSGASRSTYEPPHALWRDFVATKVSDGGRRTPFSRATNIEVGLTDRSNYKVARGQWIGWEAGCNSASARVVAAAPIITHLGRSKSRFLPIQRGGVA